jgi:two-component system, sensor histidine kinase and response regulator
MGGEIGVASEPGRGSTFWFTIAFGIPEGASIESHLALDPTAIRVLAVDDSEAQRRAFKEQFAAWNLPSETASNSEEALRILMKAAGSSSPFRAAIIDLNMPSTDGFELAMAIRARQELQSVALMVLLSPEDEVDSQKLRDMGFAGQVSKPVPQSQLFNAIMNAIAAVPRRHTPICREEQVPVKPSVSERLRILVAEDNEINQIVVREVLERAGHHCEVAPDGQRALDAVMKKQYDLVLMDCQMPVMDGFDSARAIRRAEAASVSRVRIPIVALTANAMKGDREKCLEAGMDAYTSKPINPQELLRTIEESFLARGGVAQAA